MKKYNFIPQHDEKFGRKNNDENSFEEPASLNWGISIFFFFVDLHSSCIVHYIICTNIFLKDKIFLYCNTKR